MKKKTQVLGGTWSLTFAQISDRFCSQMIRFFQLFKTWNVIKTKIDRFRLNGIKLLAWSPLYAVIYPIIIAPLRSIAFITAAAAAVSNI